MSGSYSRKWGSTRTHKKEPATRVNCFPYGVSNDFDSLDVMTDVRPASLVFGYFAAYSIAVVLLCTLIAVLLTPHLGSAVSAMAGLLLGAGLFSVLTTTTPQGLLQYIDRSVVKLRYILVDDKGVKFVAKSSRPFNLQVTRDTVLAIPWKNLRAVQLVNPQEENFNKLTVRFSGHAGKPFEIPLLSIHTQENWTTVAEAIHARSPQVELDPQIIRALTLFSTDSSFTELWLASLRSAPAENALIPLQSGRSIGEGRFVIQSKLASGGQGSAYAGIDTTTGADVAIKEYLLPVYQSSRVRANAIEQIEAESRILARISHPQIVQFIDLFEEDNRAFLILNRIRGINLKQHVKQHGPVDTGTARDLAKQMCDILSYLHSMNLPVIHRDFTPENLLIDKNQQLTLIDFTISEPSGVATGLPPAGKPSYMPPEQYSGECSPQSDIYSFGATLYFLLTGRDPEALTQLDLRSGADQTDAVLASVIFNCTAQHQSERYKSMQAIAAEL